MTMHSRPSGPLLVGRVVDTLGLRLTVMVTAANVTDRQAGSAMLARLHERHWRITLVWATAATPGT